MKTKILRVYDDKGDFTIEIPADARVTFGYFNPVTGQTTKYQQSFGDGAQTMKTTALRIYTKEKGEPETQLACFLGVKGFRADSIKLTRLRERIIVENFRDDDGEGNIAFTGKQRRQIEASPEPGTFQ
jgi:hypothetical protein